MSYRIEKGEAPGPAVRRIAGEQLTKALLEVGDREQDVAWRIHQLRKRCKKIRAAIRLVRAGFPGYPEANARFRDIARQLSAHRDARVTAALIDDVEEQGEIYSSGGNPAERWYWLRCELAEEHALGVLSQVADALAEAAVAVEHWEANGVTHDDLRRGFEKTLAHAQKCYEALRDDPESAPPHSFHRWRRWCRYHALHLQLLRDWLPGEDGSRRKLAGQVEELIGDAHDCSALLDSLAAQPAYIAEHRYVRQLTAALLERRRERRRKGLQLANELFANEPALF